MKYFTLDQYPAKRTQHYCSYWANNPPPFACQKTHCKKLPREIKNKHGEANFRGTQSKENRKGGNLEN